MVLLTNFIMWLAVGTACDCLDTAMDVGVDEAEASVKLFPECGTIVHLQAGTSERGIGSEEVTVHLDCRKTSSGVADSRIVVSGWYVVDGGAKECNHVEGRQWRLMADVLQCIHDQLCRHPVLSKYHSAQVRWGMSTSCWKHDSKRRELDSELSG